MRYFSQLIDLFCSSSPLETLRFFRAAIGLRDMDINAMLVRQNVFAFITQLLIDTNTQQNHTIHSEIEELLDFIRNVSIDQRGGKWTPVNANRFGLADEHDQSHRSYFERIRKPS